MDVVSVLVLRALSTFSDIYDYAHLVCLGSLRETKLSRKKLHCLFRILRVAFKVQSSVMANGGGGGVCVCGGGGGGTSDMFFLPPPPCR